MSTLDSGSRFSTRLVDYPDPFITFSNAIYPRTVGEVMRWAEWIWLRHGLYSSALKKCIRYFLTDIELAGDDLSSNTRRKYTQFLLEQLNILDTLGIIGDDVVGFGNAFTSVAVPIKRSLVCPHCGASRPLINLQQNKDYRWKDWSFWGDCPMCGVKNVKYKRIDLTKVDDHNHLHVIRWAPQHVSVKACTITGQADYFYEVPPEEKARIKEGEHIYIATVPWEFIEAVKKDVPFRFSRDTFKHLKCQQIASMGPKLKGWGLPLFMSNFSQVVHMQILERYNEAIAMDYIVPFRVLTPPAGQGKGDPLVSFNMANFMGQVRNMIRKHKMDPTTWHTLPFPLNYQMLGGEARNLAPVELLDRALDNLLSSMGVPQEFYKTSLRMTDSAPIGLRMFERLWGHHTTMFDEWLNWFLGQCSRIMSWEKVTGRIMRTSIAEDNDTKQVKLNLASSNIVSKYTALKAFNINYEYEQDRMSEERREEAERQMEEQSEAVKMQTLSETMTQATQAPPMGQIPPNAGQPNMGLPPPPPGGAPGGAPQGGMPPGPGGMPGPSITAGPMGSNPPTLDQMLNQAQQIAQQLFSADPVTRRGQLVNMKRQNPSLHALIKQEMDNMAQSAGSQGVQMARQQGGQQ